MMSITKAELAKMIDYGPQLALPCTKEQIRLSCTEALKYGFATVYVAPWAISLAKKELKGSNVRVGSAFSYPWGDITTDSKIFELKQIIYAGVDCVDGVINISALKSGEINYVKEEAEELVCIARKEKKNLEIKLMIESCWLTNEEIITAARIIKDSGADFIKTSTGWAAMGCTVDEVKLIRETVGPDFGVKAAGGTSGTIDRALAIIEAGANRLGESSAVMVIEGLDILQRVQSK